MNLSPGNYSLRFERTLEVLTYTWQIYKQNLQNMHENQIRGGFSLRGDQPVSLSQWRRKGLPFLTPKSSCHPRKGHDSDHLNTGLFWYSDAIYILPGTVVQFIVNFCTFCLVFEQWLENGPMCVRYSNFI